MSDLIRKQFYITREQDSLLKSKAKEFGLKEAEIVREALDSQISQLKFFKDPLKIWEQEIEFIEGLKEGKRTTSIGRTWKREDLYER